MHDKGDNISLDFQAALASLYCQQTDFSLWGCQMSSFTDAKLPAN